MMTRLHIQNQTHIAEWPDTEPGMMQAKAFRKSHPEFRRRRIKQVLQVYPEFVPCGEAVQKT